MDPKASHAGALVVGLLFGVAGSAAFNSKASTPAVDHVANIVVLETIDGGGCLPPTPFWCPDATCVAGSECP